MTFTGKAAYSAGGQLPELSEDLSDLIAIVSPYETPLLDALGDSMRETTSTYHEWREGTVKRGNFTQKFTAKVEVCNNEMKVSQLGLADEMDYQKQERVRELLRDLENKVINAAEEKSMMGIIMRLSMNIFCTGFVGFPLGNVLNEDKITYVLKQLWEKSSGNIDLIVVGGYQKRVMNKFLVAKAKADDTEANLYHSDYGICKIVTCRWVPQDAVLFLDSSRINVLPLAGNSFHFKPIAKSGDYECGEVIGEYTLELKNEENHAVIRDLAISKET